MRRALVLMGLLAAFAAAPAHADETGMTPAIGECLQKNAATVEAVEPDLTKATDYLVGYACAAPVAEEQQRLNAMRSKDIAERNRAQCLERVAQQKAQDAALSQPPKRTYENCQFMYDNLLSNTRFPVIIGIANRPAAAVSMAAKLILDIRVAHNKPRP